MNDPLNQNDPLFPYSGFAGKLGPSGLVGVHQQNPGPVQLPQPKPSNSLLSSRTTNARLRAIGKHGGVGSLPSYLSSGVLDPSLQDNPQTFGRGSYANGFAEGGEVDVNDVGAAADEDKRRREAEALANSGEFAAAQSTFVPPQAPAFNPNTGDIPVPAQAPSYQDKVAAAAANYTPEQWATVAQEAAASGYYDTVLPVLRDIAAQYQQVRIDNPNAMVSSPAGREDIRAPEGSLRGQAIGQQPLQQGTVATVPQGYTESPLVSAARIAAGPMQVYGGLNPSIPLVTPAIENYVKPAISTAINQAGESPMIGLANRGLSAAGLPNIPNGGIFTAGNYLLDKLGAPSVGNLAASQVPSHALDLALTAAPLAGEVKPATTALREALAENATRGLAMREAPEALRPVTVPGIIRSDAAVRGAATRAENATRSVADELAAARIAAEDDAAALAARNTPAPTPPTDLEQQLQRSLNAKGVTPDVTPSAPASLTPQEIAAGLQQGDVDARIAELTKNTPDPTGLPVNDPEKYQASQLWARGETNPPHDGLQLDEVRTRLYNAGLDSHGSEAEVRALYDAADGKGIKLPYEEPPSGMPDAYDLAREGRMPQSPVNASPLEGEGAKVYDGHGNVIDTGYRGPADASPFDRDAFLNSPNGQAAAAQREGLPPGVTPSDTGLNGASINPPAALPSRPPSVDPNAWQQAMGVISAPLNTLFAGGHMFRQGVGAAVTHPGEAVTALKGFGLALFDQAGKLALQQSVRDAGELLADGHRLSDMKALSGNSQRVNPTFAEKVTQRIPVVAQLKDGGMTYLGLLRDSIYNNAAAKLERLVPDASDKMFTDLYATISHNTGHMTGRGGVQGVMGTAQGLGLGPSAVVARFQALADPLIKGGGPIPFVNAGARAEAVRSLLGNAGVIALTGAVGSQLGGNVNLPFGANAKDLTNPYGIDSSLFHATFNSATGFKTTYSGGAGYDTLVKLFANAAIDLDKGNITDKDGLADHLLAWSRGQIGPIPSKVVDLITGSDWQGKPVDLNTLKGEAHEGFWRSWAPIAAQSMKDAYDGWGPKGLAMALPSLGAYEVGTRLRTPADLRQEVLGGKIDLLPHEAQSLNAALQSKYPDNFAHADELKDPAVHAHNEAVAKIEADKNARVDRIFQGMQDGTYSRIAGRQAITEIKNQAAAASLELQKDPAYRKVIADMPDNSGTAQRALDVWYSIPNSAKDEKGKIDYTKVEALQQDFLDHLSRSDPSLASRLQKEVHSTNPNDHPFLQALKEEQPLVSHYLDKSVPPAQHYQERIANPFDDAKLVYLGYEPHVLSPKAEDYLHQMVGAR